MPWFGGGCSELADFTEPDAPFVQELVREALPWLEVRTGRKYSVFTTAASAGGEAVRAAAWVLYDQLLACKPPIRIDPSPQTHAEAQYVRGAQNIKADQRADCLDLALLFGSCALQARLDPLLILVHGGDAEDHALVGLWLGESGPKRSRALESDGIIATDAIPTLLGAGRFADAADYWNRICEADLLVVDCSGAALGYPDYGRQGLNFEDAVAEGWDWLMSTSARIRCALDLRQARCRTPFPIASRPDVVGREDDLAQIATAATSRNVVVAGWLGVGKTVLALKYAFEHRHQYPDGVFLLNAADQARALEQLAGFARQSGINPEWHRDRGGEPRSNVGLAALWANKVSEPGSRALLIVDDVAEATFITEPIAGLVSLSSLKCRLLITTRDVKLLSGETNKDSDAGPDFETIVLLPLADEDATALLLSMLPPERQDQEAARGVCRQLNNLPLLIRVAGLTLAGAEATSLLEYKQRLGEEGFLATADPTVAPPDYPRITSVLREAWQGLAERVPGPREVLKLLSVLPRNESVPFELLALMVNMGDNAADEKTCIEQVCVAVAELSATGLAEQPEEESVRIHPVVHEFAAYKAGNEEKFVERALETVVERLHDPNFYRIREDNDLIRSGEQLRLLREPGKRDARLREVLSLFDAQLDYLRAGYDALAQLAMQARLGGSDELAKVLERVRRDRMGPWFRLRWHGRHERGHDPEAAGHSDAVSAVAIWPESGEGKGPADAVSGAENGELIQWSLGPLKLKRRLADAGPPISGLCISPDGATLYASAWDGSLRAIALDGEGQGEARIAGRHAYPANDCAIDPDGRFVVSVSDDGTVRVYDLPQGRLLRALRHAEHAPVLRCAVARRSQSDNEPILITASRAGVVRVWNPLTGEELGDALDILPAATREPVSACALTPDGELAAVATRHKVLLWNPHTGEKANLSTPEHYVADCRFSPDGKRLVLVGRSKRLAIYRLDDQAMEHPLDPWYHWLTACAFGASGQIFFASDDGSVQSCTYDSHPASRRQGEIIQGRPNWVNVFRAGADHALSVSTDQTICRWNLASGKLERTIEGHANWVNAFDVSSDGVHVLSGTDSGDVVYWPLSRNSERTYLKGFGQRSNACAISEDGTIGLAGSEDSSLRQWALEGDFGQRKHLTDGHRAAVTTCAIKANGEAALSGGDDARVVLWNLKDGAIKRTFDLHQDRITGTVFAGDQSEMLLSSSWDGTVKCWSAQSGKLLTDFREHNDGVTAIGSATGGVAFSVSLDRTLRRWKLSESSSDIRIHLGHRLRGLVVAPSGAWVLCSDMAGTVYLFDVVDGPRSVD